MSPDSAPGPAADGGARPAILLKLGGSLITEKSGHREARLEVLQRLARELAETRNHWRGRLILGHGSGSFGHFAASHWGYRPGSGFPEAKLAQGASAVQRAAADLHRLVIEALEHAGARPFSLPPSAFMVLGPTPKITTADPLKMSLQAGMLPVVYGDVVASRARVMDIASTETVLLAIAEHLGAEGQAQRSAARSPKPGSALQVGQALWLGETMGLYDSSGALIPYVRPGQWRALAEEHDGASGPDVTGGIRHRLFATGALAEMGVESWLLDGRKPGLLAAALRGESVHGTRIMVDEAR